MIAQRPADAAPVVQAVAEALPFADDSFDATLAVLTIHHWAHPAAGLAEMARVARKRVVVVTFDFDVNDELWIVRDYLPEAADFHADLPSLASILDELPSARVEFLLAPRDCSDRMFAALWGRPEEYLAARVRAGASIWQQIPESVTERALDRLRGDLASGAWDERYGHLRKERELSLIHI